MSDKQSSRSTVSKSSEFGQDILRALRTRLGLVEQHADGDQVGIGRMGLAGEKIAILDGQLVARVQQRTLRLDP